MNRPFIYTLLANLALPTVRQLYKLTENTRVSQLKLALKLIKSNQNCKFGKLHNFVKINSLHDFQNYIPINDYDYFKEFIDELAYGGKNILTHENPYMFAATSGTTNSQKLIPVNNEYLKCFRKASIVSGYNLLKAYPKINRGVTLSVFGSACDSYTAAGIPIGSISGALMKSEPKIVKGSISPLPYEITAINDWQLRYYIILLLALNQPITSIYTLNPSTILMLCEFLTKYQSSLIRDLYDGKINREFDLKINFWKNYRFTPNVNQAKFLEKLLSQDKFIPKYIWPDLQVISTWTKASAAYYIPSLKKYFIDVPIVDISYGASEGRGSIFINENQQLLSINSHFYEFMKSDTISSNKPKVYLADELKVNEYYNILLTTQAGLYRYNIGDVIKVTGFINSCPTIEFSHKSSNISSFTGEKLTENQVVKAFSKTIDQFNLTSPYFTLIPVFAQPPYYLMYVELDENSISQNLDELAHHYDINLKLLNSEYEAKRKSLRLGDIKIRQLKSGTYKNLRHFLTQNGASDAQVKISNLNPKVTIRDFLDKSLVNA